MNNLKILVIAFHFPPLLTAGTYRTARFVKHLNKFDLDAVVLSIKNPDPSICPTDPNSEPMNTFFGCPVYRARQLNVTPFWRYPVGLLNKINRIFPRLFKNGPPRWGFKFIDIQWGWIIPAYFKAKKLVKQHNIDLIYVSSPPRSSVIIGLLLKKKFNLPLVLDFRDKWLLYAWENNKEHFYNKLHTKIIKSADSIITVTWGLEDFYKTLTSPDKVHLIFNGYDMHYHPKELEYTCNKLFTVLYLGGWVHHNRSPENLIYALKSCTFPWQLISIGNNNELINEIAKKYQVQSNVSAIPSTSKKSLIHYIDRAHVLFVIQGGKDNSAIACKTMDYLATGKHILAQVDIGDNRRFIEEYAKQYSIVDYSDQEGLKQALEKIHATWQNNGCLITENTVFLENFSGEKLTESFSNVIKTTYAQFHSNISE